MKTAKSAVLALVLVVPLFATASAQNDSPAEPEVSDAYSPVTMFDRPIRYHFDDSNVSWSVWWYKYRVRQAFSWWEQDPQGLLPRDVRFEPVARDANPDIVIWLRDAPIVGETCNHEPTALGCANTTTRGRHWDLEIKMQTNDGQYLGYGTVGDVAKHEIGHALFLPHLPDRASIMFAALDTHRPGDAQPVQNPAPLIAGVAFLILVIVAGYFVVKRQFSKKDEDAWTPLASECPATADGAHALQRMSVLLNDEWAWADACPACKGARLVE